MFLNWEQRGGVEAYHVSYRSASDHTSTTDELPESQSTYAAPTLSCDEVYTFHVQAKGDQHNFSPYYGPASVVTILPSDSEPATSVVDMDPCPEDVPDCLEIAKWPPFQAIYQEFHSQSMEHNPRSPEYGGETYYGSHMQIKHIDWRADYDWRITTIANLEWEPDIGGPGSARGIAFGDEGSYVEQKGLLFTRYGSFSPADRTDRLTVSGESVFNLISYYLDDGVLGIPEDYAGVCYRNVCEPENAALRFGDSVVTNDGWRIPLAGTASPSRPYQAKVLTMWIDAERE